MGATNASYNGLPVMYDYANFVGSLKSPGTVHCQNSDIVNYFTKYLLQKAISVFKWTMPETWERNYVLYTLYCNGVVAVFKTDKYGVIPNHCGLYGYNVQWQPTDVLIYNPLIRTTQLKIGRNCEILKLQPNYSGIMDIVTYYADILGLMAEAAGMNLVNSKLSFVFSADSKAMAETFKKLYDRVASGECASVVDKNLFDENGEPRWLMFNQDVGSNYITDRLLVDMRTVVNMFCSDIGIPNSNTNKKERLITDEVNANDFETKALATLWLDELQMCCDKINAMFDTGLAVDWRKEVLDNGSDGINQSL